MRKIIAIMGLAAALSATAINPGQPVAIDCGATQAFHPVLSPDGKALLFSTVDHTGLSAINLADGTVSVIDADAAAGFCPVFTADGKQVVYRTARLQDGLMCRDVRLASLDGTGKKNVAGFSRRDIDLNKTAGNATYAYADFDKIKVTLNGVEKDVNPLEDAHSYLWASLSPDGTQLMFTEPFSGVYVCATDGTGARRIAAKGDFAAWAGNDTAVMTVSHDDGYVLMSSQLVAVDVNTGNTTVLTDADTMVGESTAAAGKAVFSTVDGALFSITLE